MRFHHELAQGVRVPIVELDCLGSKDDRKAMVVIEPPSVDSKVGGLVHIFVQP